MIILYFKSWWDFWTGGYNRRAVVLEQLKPYECQLAADQKRINRVVGKFNSRPKRAKKRKV